MVFLALLFPPLLLLLLGYMERIEKPLRSEMIGDRVGEFLATARPDEIETFISSGMAPALERYWRRQRVSKMLPLTGRRSTSDVATGS